MSYNLQLAQIWNDFGKYVERQGLVGLPASFAAFTFSVWTCALKSHTEGGDAQTMAFDTGLTTGGAIFGLQLYSDRVIFSLWSGDVTVPANAIWDGGIVNVTPPAAWPGLQHWLISVNTAANTAQVYVNDVAGTLDGASPPWNSTAACANPGAGPPVEGQFWLVEGGLPSTAPFGFGDLWFNPAFLDLTVTANRRKFIGADGLAVDLGASGAVPTGTSPPIFLHIPTGGTADDIAANAGTGGAWTVFTAPLELDTVCAPEPPPPPDPLPDGIYPDPPMVWLSWSDDRGHSFGNPVGISLGATGKYLTSLQWQRLGIGRSRVFCLEWSSPVRTALMGAWIDRTPAQT